MSVEQIRNTLRRDIDADFLEKIAVRLPWAYDTLFDSVSENEALTDDHVRDERFNKRRGEVASDEIATAARQCGVPFEFRRLDCNGQHKLLVKSGNCLLIQEPVDSFRDHPALSDYKKNLADVHGYVRQLELDLRDQPLRIRDWSGCVLGVLLHGPAGPKFSKDHRALGGLMLAVPDSAYQQWIVRYDLLGVALYGREGFWQPKYPQPLAVEQEDKVIVRKKRKNLDRESA